MNEQARVRLGIVGCGAVSEHYFPHLRRFPVLEIASCADIDAQLAHRRGAEYRVPCAASVEALLTSENVDVVVNLTPPAAHAEIALSAIRHGKHVWNEKPLAIAVDEGHKIVESARAKGLYVGCAPDTFLGSAQQSARLAIDEGCIGQPVAVTAMMLCPGHESWHPNPRSYYQPGGGPMFDMGPYYLAAMMNMLGPIKRVSGQASIVKAERVITHRDAVGDPGPRFGETISVETPDHVAGLIEFESGCTGTIVTSFAGDAEDEPFPLVVYGIEGTIRVANPNHFDGRVQVRKLGSRSWQDLPTLHCQGYGRGVGVAELVTAMRAQRTARCSGDFALAVLDVMHGFFDSARSGEFYRTRFAFPRPEALQPTLDFGEFGEFAP